MPTAAAPARIYRLFGLTIMSELPLALAEHEPRDQADVVIRFGRVEPGGDASQGYSLTDRGTLLWVPKVGRYLIVEGREVVMDPAEGASERNLRLFLLGSALGALLHQRGLLPLHANAIEIEGRAVAFSGHSGAGKSTIAAWFHDRGHRILADDVCVVGFDETGRAVAFPGIPRLRLWREALEASGRDAAAYDRSFDSLDKYDVPTRFEPADVPVPLAAVYLLRKADDPGESAIERLTGVEAVETLVANTYRGNYLRTIGKTGPHLAACLAVARSVPIFRAQRLWGFDRFDAEAALLHDHAREQAIQD